MSRMRGVAFAIAAVFAAAAARADIVINEIMYNSVESPDVEYIEIYNNGAVAVDLTNWAIVDSDPLHEHCPLVGTMPAGGYLVVAGFLGTFQSKYPGVANVNPVPFDSTTVGRGFSLGNGGDTIYLLDAAGIVHDAVSYDDVPPWPTAANGTGPSLELIHPARDNALPSSWEASTNAPAQGTPGSQNSVYTTDHAPIVDTVARSVPIPSPTDTVVVTARVTDDHGVTGVVLHVDLGSGYAPQTMYDDGLHGDGPAGDQFYGASILPRPQGALVKYYVAADDTIGQTATFPAAAPTEYVAYTVGWKVPSLFVNEILASNLNGIVDELGQAEDWLELRNRDVVPIDLGGMFLSDNLDKPQVWRIPPSTIVPPGGRLLFWCDNDAIQGPLHTTFKLTKASGRVGLFETVDHGNTLVHGFYYGLQNTDVSFGFYPEDADAPDYMVTPTPSASNDTSSLYSPVCINEFQTTSSAGGIDDYIELYNRTVGPVDIGSWHLTDDVDLPTKYTFPPGTALGGFGRIIVNETELGFSLSSSGSEVVHLVGPDGLTGQDYFDYGPQSMDVTQGRYPDGTGYWHFFSPHSLGSSNTCSGGGSLPAVVNLRFTGKSTIGWDPLTGAQDYDLQRGDLAALRATSGNFTAAILGCVENDSTDTRSWVPDAPGPGRFYLVRGVTFACGRGTFDDGSASQSGLRDQEVSAGAACP
jgi:hypothetical protein